MWTRTILLLVFSTWAFATASGEEPDRGAERTRQGESGGQMVSPEKRNPVSSGVSSAAEPVEESSDPGMDAKVPATGNDVLSGQDIYSDVEEIQIQGARGMVTEVDSSDSSLVFSGDTLEKLGVDDVSDLARVTPNLEIRTAGATTANFFIRGVGLADFSANAPSAVAIYQDGVALSAPALQRAQIFDVANVEVIRGPVGAGSGRNASAGVIRIDSRKPSGNFGAEIRSQLYWYESPDAERSAMGQEYEGGIDIPIIEDWLWSRFSFVVREADPYMRNGCSNRAPELVTIVQNTDLAQTWKVCGIQQFAENAAALQPGLPEFVGDQGNWAARAQFRVQPDGWNMDWLLNFHGSRLDQDSTLGQAMGTGNSKELGGATNFYTEPDQQAEFVQIQVDNDLMGQNTAAYGILGPILASERPLDTRPYRGDYNRIGKTTLDTWGAFLSGDIALDFVDLTSITAYESYERSRDVDQDFTPLILFESDSTDSAWQFSQEVKGSGEGLDGALRWNLGGWYLMETMNLDITQQVGSGDLGNYLRTWTQDSWGYAFYGGAEWDFLDDFTLEAGIRYNWERKTFNYFRLLNLFGQYPQTSNQTATWAEPTGTIQLKYRFSELLAVYWKYTHGFKAGYFNANDADEGAVSPESINAIETGFRGSWLDGMLSLSGDVFYYRYRDYQVFQFTDEPNVPPVLEILNAERAEVYGSEIQLQAIPLQDLLPEEWAGLRVQTDFGWLSSQFLEFTHQVTRASGTETFLKTINYAGNQLPNSPNFTVTVSVEWGLDLGSWGTLTPRYDMQWTDDLYFDSSEGKGSYSDDGIQTKPDYTVGQPAYALHNLQLIYGLPNGMAEARIWARNISDTRYKDFAFDASFFTKLVINFVGPPRSVGFDLKFNF